MDMRFDASLRALQNRFAKASQSVRDHAESAAAEASRVAVAVAKENTPSSDGEPGSEGVGGRLRASWGYRLESRGSFVRSTVFNSDPRANRPTRGEGTPTLLFLIEYGSRPHRISAINAKVLAYYDRALGKMVFKKSIWHPGTPAYAPLLRARLAARGPFIAAMARLKAQVLAEVR